MLFHCSVLGHLYFFFKFPSIVGIGQWVRDYIFLYYFSSNLKLQEFTRYLNLKL